ncbi:unnamed protein product [Schistocephalus solidus]|uniref:Uncharacterized protein n=1 Tax=Schistocephalus solidus TaxID=70667 RepID=A0A3P7CYS1_SCHSO|nr:unnamed protein product [Schistocephalus solidus]
MPTENIIVKPEDVDWLYGTNEAAEKAKGDIEEEEEGASEKETTENAKEDVSQMNQTGEEELPASSSGDAGENSETESLLEEWTPMKLREHRRSSCTERPDHTGQKSVEMLDTTVSTVIKPAGSTPEGSSIFSTSELLEANGSDWKSGLLITAGKSDSPEPTRQKGKLIEEFDLQGLETQTQKLSLIEELPADSNSSNATEQNGDLEMLGKCGIFPVKSKIITVRPYASVTNFCVLLISDEVVSSNLDTVEEVINIYGEEEAFVNSSPARTEARASLSSVQDNAGKDSPPASEDEEEDNVAEVEHSGVEAGILQMQKILHAAATVGSTDQDDNFAPYLKRAYMN